MEYSWVYTLLIVGLTAAFTLIWSRFDPACRLLGKISQRDPLDDDTFRDHFDYPAQGAGSHVASDVRRICAKHLGLNSEQLRPGDDLYLLTNELDIEPLVTEIQSNYNCNLLDDSPRKPYTLAHLIDYVALNRNIVH